MATDLTTTTVASVGDVLWSQWRSLGVPAAAEPARRLIDPEALIVYTAVLTEAFGDDRLRDGAISWCVRHHSLVANARMKKLSAIVRDSASDAFPRFAHQVGQHVKRLPWSPTADAPTWKPSTDVRLPRLDRDPFLLRLRCRAMFGANARGEAVAFLACVGDWVVLSAIERETGFSRTQINDAIEGLVQAGWATRGMLGNAVRYGLSNHARAELTTPIVEHRTGPRELDVIHAPAAPTWIDWQPRFELLLHVIEAASAIDDGDLVRATATLRAQEDAFRDAHMSAPMPMRGDVDVDQHEADLRRFIGDAVSNLGGHGILP